MEVSNAVMFWIGFASGAAVTFGSLVIIAALYFTGGEDGMVE